MIFRPIVKYCTYGPNHILLDIMQEVTFVSMSCDRCHILHSMHCLHVLQLMHVMQDSCNFLPVDRILVILPPYESDTLDL